MAYNLLRCERDQSYLMPPSMRDWLSEGHLAWFIVDAVGQMDLREFYAAYRSDGWGAAAYDPGMMVAILLYAYCLGLRSSRRIGRALEEDVGFRVVAANQQPDFRTICRFRAEHVKGGGMLGQEGGAKVYHQRFLASVNVRASCSGVVSQRQASYRLVSG